MKTGIRSAALVALMSGIVLTGCGSVRSTNTANTAEMVAPEAAQQNLGNVASAPMAAPTTQDVVSEPLEVPRSQPQLVKTASLSVVVESVSEGIDQVRSIARQQQGDVLSLQDQTPGGGSRHRSSMQIRVPQDRLDATLKALSELGTVQQQSIAAEDVSNQLVDFQARLRNLRKTEELLLEIMERSGSVADVLKVAQEVSNVRNSIEQIDAQLSQLQSRVAYSMITFNLEENLAETLPQRSTQTQLAQSWTDATRSIGKLTVDLLQLGIWLLVYSPYWLALIGIGVWVYRKQQASDRASRPTD